MIKALILVAIAVAVIVYIRKRPGG